MSVPDHQIDPPEVTVGIAPGNGDMSVSLFHPNQEHPYSVGDQIEINGREGTISFVDANLVSGEITYTVRSLGLADHQRVALEWPRMEVLTNDEFYQDENTTLINQIMTIFTAHFPLEDRAYRWWAVEPIYQFELPNTHEKRTRYYLEKYPWWKLWKIDKKLEEEKLSPTIDHPRSDIVIGKSKAAAAYFQHNDNFKKFIQRLLP